MRLTDWAKRLCGCGTLALALGLPCSSALAQSSTTEPQYKSSLAFYLWIPGWQGDAAIRGIPFDIDTSVSDTLDAFQDNGDGAFALHYERILKSWTFITDLNYWKLRFDETTPIGRLSGEPSSWMVEIAGARTISEKALKTPGLKSQIQVLGGLRYTRLELEVNNETLGTSRDGHQDWVDPFIGARIAHDLSQRWALGGRFDIGGFGVGSDFTWNLIANLDWKLSKKNSLFLGWRIIDQDFEDGGFKWDVEQAGPFVAFQMRF